jgi:chromosome segregation ATPase
MIQSLRAIDAEEQDLGIGYQDTVALLQEEIARLEEELRVAHASRLEVVHDAGAAPDPAAERRVAEMSAELSKRDETIALLFDQIRSMEEAALASRGEWDQLEGWVREVEQRVDSREEVDQEHQAVLEAELIKLRAQLTAAEEARARWEAERADFETERAHATDEIARLQHRFDAAASQPSDSQDSAIVEALEREIQDLREACEALRRSEAQSRKLLAETGDSEALRHDAEALRHEVSQLRGWIAEMEAEFEKARDERLRERNEYEAEIASLKTELANAALKLREAPAAPAAAAVTPSFEALTGRSLSTPGSAGPQTFEGMGVEDRMWAFRKHLQEVHQREMEERRNRKLSVRLSRLWGRTAPKK